MYEKHGYLKHQKKHQNSVVILQTPIHDGLKPYIHICIVLCSTELIVMPTIKCEAADCGQARRPLHTCQSQRPWVGKRGPQHFTFSIGPEHFTFSICLSEGQERLLLQREECLLTRYGTLCGVSSQLRPSLQSDPLFMQHPPPPPPIKGGSEKNLNWS